jgi:hypothetical protein
MFLNSPSLFRICRAELDFSTNLSPPPNQHPTNNRNQNLPQRPRYRGKPRRYLWDPQRERHEASRHAGEEGQRAACRRGEEGADLARGAERGAIRVQEERGGLVEEDGA